MVITAWIVSNRRDVMRVFKKSERVTRLGEDTKHCPMTIEQSKNGMFVLYKKNTRPQKRTSIYIIHGKYSTFENALEAARRI